MKLLLALLLFCFPMTAQTRYELEKKIGTPVSATYQVHPNISVSIFYSKEGNVCRMLVKPNITEIELPAPTAESLKTVTDELVPRRGRGKNIINGFLSGIEVYGTTNDYENLKISHAFNQKNEIWVSVVWKDQACNIMR